MYKDNNPYQRYRQIQVETANPLELIILLFDGGIKFTNQARKAIKEKNYEQANINIQKVQKIINELNMNLNMDAGEIASNLRSIYNFINERLIEANLRKDNEILSEVGKLLVEMKGTWVELQTPKNNAVGAGDEWKNAQG